MLATPTSVGAPKSNCFFQEIPRNAPGRTETVTIVGEPKISAEHGMPGRKQIVIVKHSPPNRSRRNTQVGNLARSEELDNERIEDSRGPKGV
jgi:hypothetical protein